MMAEQRPDLKAVHFSHTPFCDPMTIRVLPDDAAVELFEGMAGYRGCGFHSARWCNAFEACSKEVIGRSPATYVSYAAADADDVMGVAASAECDAELARLEEQIGDRQLIVRVDRIELSKNILRGFQAFEDLLQTRPDLRERVVFAASIYPSREGLADYLAYRQEVHALVERINETWSTDEWTPIVLNTSDNFARSVAALRRYDVLLVNPIRDGLNLVAKEGAIVNERHGVLVLSREAGVFDVLKDHALAVNPFDVAGTADVLAAALEMPAAARKERAEALREIAMSRTSTDWLQEQLDAAQPDQANS
jgi:trehalose 6-phosphate synthase